MTVASFPSRTADATSRPAPSAQPQPMAGFGTVLRFVTRRDRLRMAVWVIAVLVVVVMGSASVIGLYSTPADLQQYAVVAQADTAVKAMAGPGYGLDDPTEGAVVMNECNTRRVGPAH